MLVWRQQSPQITSIWSFIGVLSNSCLSSHSECLINNYTGYVTTTCTTSSAKLAGIRSLLLILIAFFVTGAIFREEGSLEIILYQYISSYGSQEKLNTCAVNLTGSIHFNISN